MTSVDPYRPPAPSPRGWVVRQYDPLIAVPAATAAATLPQPEVWAGRHAYTTAPAAAAVATAIAPALLVDIGLSVPIVTAAADAPVPELYVGPDIMFVTAPAAAATADIPAPYVDVPLVVDVTAATATATATPPAVGGDYYIEIAVPAAAASADAPTAAVSVGATITAPAATATATATAPSQAGVVKTVAPAAVSATATANAFNLYIGSATPIAESAHGLYGQAFAALLNKGIDVNSDEWKVALHTSSLTIDPDSHQYWDAAPYSSTQASGTNYPAGGDTISPFTVAYNTNSNETRATAGNDLYFDNTTISFRYAVLYDNTPANNKPLLAWWDYGSTKTASGTYVFIEFGGAIVFYVAVT